MGARATGLLEAEKEVQVKALSISQPYAWLIAHGHKDIENRNWSTYHRGMLLIHAPKEIDWRSFDEHDILFAPYFGSMASSHTLAAMPRRKQDYETGGIVGVAQLAYVVTQSTSSWFVGKYGFVLKDARPLPLIRCRGALGIFEVSEEIEERVRAYLVHEKEA